VGTFINEIVKNNQLQNEQLQVILNDKEAKKIKNDLQAFLQITIFDFIKKQYENTEDSQFVYKNITKNTIEYSKILLEHTLSSNNEEASKIEPKELYLLEIKATEFLKKYNNQFYNNNKKIDNISNYEILLTEKIYCFLSNLYSNTSDFENVYIDLLNESKKIDIINELITDNYNFLNDIDKKTLILKGLNKFDSINKKLYLQEKTKNKMQLKNKEAEEVDKKQVLLNIINKIIKNFGIVLLFIATFILSFINGLLSSPAKKHKKF
jgi:hypothetical protein